MMYFRTVDFCAPLRRLRPVGLAAMLLISSAFTSSSPAALITFAASNLADITPGQDLWEYTYRVSLANFGAGEGFTVNFNRSLYTLLQSPPPVVNADWDALTIQPDLALHSDGFYDALALRNAPSLANPFIVRFVWLGSGVPGAQPFTVHDQNFSVISQGQTAPIPEPSTRLFMICIPAAVLLSGRAGHPRRRAALAR